MLPWFKAVDVLVLSNQEKSEISKNWTSPMKMFEYMASKRPIIASDLSSIREILNKYNATLVKSDDSEDLASNINVTLKNKDFSAKILTEAFGNVQKYSWLNRVKTILFFIKSL